MHFIHRKKRIVLCLISLILLLGNFSSHVLTVHATYEELIEEAEERKSLPVQSNEITNWPRGPRISAESAILMDVNTGVILYAKNIHEKCYPASITKVLTCLLAMEHGDLDDMVSFSHEAVFSVPGDGSNMGMDVGESITLEQSLYGILVGSANEVANAVGEYVGGTIDDFVTMMNERATELGCTDSHFANTNGLFDENHYTSAYDLALISSQFFQNEMLCKISDTPRYHFEPTSTQPDDFYLINKHQLINGEIAYDGIVGGKTGFTSESRQTLITCAEKSGMKLVCVVFKEESPAQFTDTVALFDYGFQNFQVLNISENEEKYNIDNANFFQSDNDIFGSSKPILSIDEESYVIVPNMADFSDLSASIRYDVDEGNHVAEISYSYNDTYVGKAYVNLAEEALATYDFVSEPVHAPAESTITPDRLSAITIDTSPDQENTIFINVKRVLIGVLILAAIIILLFIVRAVIINHTTSRRRRNHVHRKKRRRERLRSNFDDFDF